MRLRGHGNGVAIALAGLAVVIATTGTAVAVTAGVVHISDPKRASQVARVNSSGQLSVAAAVPGTLSVRPVSAASAFNVGYFLDTGLNTLIGPTTATIAITRASVGNPRLNANAANSNFGVEIVKLTPSSAGTCYDGSVAAVATNERLPVGAQLQDAFGEAPLVFAPSGKAPYCIGLSLYSDSGTASSYYDPYGELTGYVVSGRYQSPAPLAIRGVVKHDAAHPHPAGSAPLR